jgi:hypothetical protein
VNGIKLRTRAGMGRCQSGFCLPRILTILAREKGIPEESITLFGTGSEILTGMTRNDSEEKSSRTRAPRKGRRNSSEKKSLQGNGRKRGNNQTSGNGEK